MFKIKDGLQLFNRQTTVRYPSGNYGSFEIDGGGKGNWEGYSIGGRVAFMHANGTEWGIYNDVNNQWTVRGWFQGATELFHAGNLKLATNSGGVTVTGTLTASSLVGSINYNQISNPPSIPDGNLYVRKSGDTMTGALTMSGGTPVNLGDGNHYLKKISAGYSGVTIDGPQLQGHQGGELTTNYQGDKWALRWNTSQDVHIGRNLHISGNNAYLGNGTGQSYLRIGDQVTDDNAGGWNKGVHLNAQYHGRFRIRTSNYNYGALETYYWADSSVSPSMGIYGNTSVFRFTGSITNIRNKDNATFWHSGNDGSGSGLDADLLDGVQASQFLRKDVNSTLNGGLVIEGSIDSGGTDYGYYQSAGTNLILKGDASGRSGIFFQSEKNGTNINHTSDYGFIQFHSYGYGGSSGEAIDMVIGTANDSTDHLILTTPYTTGLKFGYRNATSGTGLTTTNIWHGANDGSGSGLDADLLDGQHASAFASASHSHSYLPLSGGTVTGGTSLRAGGTHLGNHEFASASGTSTGYADAGIEIREGAYGGNSNYSAPRLAFHWGGVVASNISIDAAGAILIRNNPGTSYENLRANNFYANGTNIVWNAGNDGSGSGLDADTVDGLHESSFMRRTANSVLNMGNFNITNVNHLTFNDPGPNEGLQWLGGNDWRIFESPDNLTTNGAGNLQLATGGTRRMTISSGGTAWTSSQGTLWGSSNDGAGSGLDADLLDGQHASNFANAEYINNNYYDFTVGGDANTYYPVGISEGGHYGFQTYSISRGYSWTAPSTWNTSSHKGGLTFTFQNCGDGAWGGNDKTIRIVQFAESYTTMVGGIGLSTGGGASAGVIVWLRGGGAKYRFHSPKGSKASVSVYYSSVTASNGSVFAPRSYNSGTVQNEIYARFPVRGSGSLYSGNNVVWHAGNDGSGSGLDADLLDGIHGSSFLRSDANDSYSGTLTHSSQVGLVPDSYGKGVFGVYSSTRYQHVWSMGTAYKTNTSGTSYGNMYGLTWTHTNVGTGTNQSISGLSHQLQLRMNGTLYCAFGSGIWTSGNVTAYSDRAVKTNLEVIPNALDKVMQINGYTYDRTDYVEDPETGIMPDTRQAGVVAQEVEAILPEVVSGEEGNKAVAYGNMVALLIEAIKEQQTQIEELSSQLNSLKEKN